MFKDCDVEEILARRRLLRRPFIKFVRLRGYLVVSENFVSLRILHGQLCLENATVFGQGN